jgi:Tol biopolymer transport system component
LGPYQVTAKLGEGGMGEVYRASDTKLERDVAIKVLPAAFVEDPERLQRFEREAKLLAQLHHPNIASIFGMEESDGTRALVMELVEGPTLAERLEGGPLPSDESLSVSLQIAQALEEAHEKGIVHRDLKPQNIKASIEGKVKVLDFGLAKAMDPASAAPGAGSASQLAASPTLTLGATVQGMILGTAAYMAPEQAKGFAVDKRADIWAFGVVLYEMLTGRRLFDAPTVPETLAQVLTRAPDLDALPASTPPAIRRLLRRCLERSPRSRLRDIGDARIVIEETLGSEGGEPTAESADGGRAGSRLPWAVAAAAGVIAIAAAGVAFQSRRVGTFAATSAPIRTSILLPGALDANQVPGTFALAPDGEVLVFQAVADGKSHLFVRELAELEARPLEGTEGASFPFWSADSRDIGFFAGGDLHRVPRSGGAAQRICAARSGRGGAWSRDGTIVFAPEAGGPLWQVRASGGEPQPATRMEDGVAASHRFPAFLPDGRHFLFVAEDATAMLSWVRVASLDEPTVGRRLLQATSSPRFRAPGELVFQRHGALLTQAVDLDRLEMTGEPRQLADRPNLQAGTRSAPAVDLADDGRMLYAPPDVRPSAFVWLDRRGVELGRGTRPEGPFLSASLSPRGDRIVASSRTLDGRTTLWLLDAAAGSATRLTGPELFPWGAGWTTDGQAIATWLGGDSSTGLAGSLSLISAASGSIRRLLPISSRWILPTDASADGRILLYWELVKERGHDIGWLRLDGEPVTTDYLATKANESGGRLSPDGRFIAYVSDASGRDEAYLDTFPTPTGARRVVLDAVVERVDFRADGRELFVVATAGDSTSLFACELRLGERAEIGAPRELFSLPREWASLAPASDGDRFLLVAPEGERWPTLTLVDRWRAQLGAKR